MSETGDTPSGPGKIRIPTQLEVSNAVEAVPTIKDREGPPLAVPVSARPSARTVELGLETTDPLPSSADPSEFPTERLRRQSGFTDVPSSDDTVLEVQRSLDDAVIDPAEAPPRPASNRTVLWVVVAVAMAVVGVALVLAFA